MNTMVVKLRRSAYNSGVHRKFSRRSFLRLALGGAATAALSAVGGAGYAALIEPHWLHLTQVDIPIARLAAHLDGFTIAQMSDLHCGPVVEPAAIDSAVELVLQQRVDLTVLTGDYVSHSADYAPSCADRLATLTGGGVTFACLGNHDHWTDAEAVTAALTHAGIVVLRNAAIKAADGLWVAGLDDVWEEHADLSQALRDVPSDVTTVLLAHEPDCADAVAADGRVQLQLSGHSHGGQVWLPGIGAPMLPYLAQKYPAGRYQVGGMWLYVNRGVGLISPAMRFNCRPEVTLLRLRRAAS
jgi:hypothetical protein